MASEAPSNKRQMVTIDGNEAAAYVAHKTNEVIAIYPITPSSGMGEWCDQWSAEGKKNIWGTVPLVAELQSEGGASGAVHGALQTGSLTTTFTASQGLLLMIPNMYKIAGELTSTVFHVSARSLATQALSIFGDQSDVMSVRSTGFALLASHSVQEVMDFALMAQAATLEARVPFVHFFDGFRTSAEVMKIEQLTVDDIRAMIDDELVFKHRQRALTPEAPVLRGTAQNPDTFFQSRETVNPYYAACPAIVQGVMDKFAKLVGRQYHLFDYFGAPDAERVVVIMGSGAEACHETVEALLEKGEKIGVVKVHLFRPFSVKDFVMALPKSVKAIAVLDRTKEPGGVGEPLYQDVVTSIGEAMANGTAPFAAFPKIIGGRYGLSSKEFTPAMVAAVYDELKSKTAKNHFTVGINDDVSHTSLPYDPSFTAEKRDVVRAMFYGLGSDGTVGANKNSIKIIGEDTPNYAQGYFVYDSKKSGTTTVSHLRFGPRPIRSSYLIDKANFVGCHQWIFLEKYDVLKDLVDGGTILLNSQYPKDEVWAKLPRPVQEGIIRKKLNFYVIDGYEVAAKTGMGGRVNTIMQTCFFAISGVLPKDEAIGAIKRSIKKTYGKKGEDIVKMNFDAVDQTLANLFKVDVPAKAESVIGLPPVVSKAAPDFVKDVLAKIIEGNGNDLPVSAMPVDGTYPTGTAQWEKRNIALEIPSWDDSICIQCGKCAMVCPHASIRIKVYDKAALKGAPATFKSTPYRGKEYEGMSYTIQVAPEDCTGCELCFEVCPVKNKQETKLKALNMVPQPPVREQERANWDFFLTLPEADRRTAKVDTIKGSQFLQPLFEFSGACSGCGETPYIKLVTQLFGERTVVANATGCSSIYGGNLPTTPWTKNADGRGPAWSNSLFEDNAEFGLGYRLSIDKQTEFATEILKRLSPVVGEELTNAILSADQSDEAKIYEQRSRVEVLKGKLKEMSSTDSRQLLAIADHFVRRSVWIMGGDGWAYDIGYGGLDHVIASGRNVNILVLDTEVYSNTGGQMSKSTPRGAVAKFAAGGKPLKKKDLGLIAMTYGNVYVAQVAMGANDLQTVKAFLEAEAYNGPSLIIAYAHCIAHGINMKYGLESQKAAVDSAHWPLFRYNPELAKKGQNPFKLDSKSPKLRFEEYAYKEIRYKMLTKSAPEEAKRLIKLAQEDVTSRWHYYEQLASLKFDGGAGQEHK
ncbi:MAG TPA: pyruvate:ferredoxin (flavodoxin) oxidoreductase [Bacteroidota bacterium]|nr:pyruvate:ferredoxin (flavodoxin) oxidoreductase [Bacteroidota bacterium]